MPNTENLAKNPWLERSEILEETYYCHALKLIYFATVLRSFRYSILNNHSQLSTKLECEPRGNKAPTAADPPASELCEPKSWNHALSTVN